MHSTFSLKSSNILTKLYHILIVSLDYYLNDLAKKSSLLPRSFKDLALLKVFGT